MSIGQLLITAGFVTERQIEQATRSQAQEDIYSLFVWTDGSVQVKSGPPPKEESDWPTDLASFNVTEVLAEVEQRRADWEPVIAGLGSLNEVIVACDGGQMDGLEERHELVLSALDGRSSLLDIAQRTSLGVFDCALALKDLYQWRMVGTAPTQELLKLACARVEEGEHRNAVVLLLSLIKRNDVHRIEDITTMGRLLAACKLRRKASEFLLTAAFARHSTEEQLKLASQAHGIAPRSRMVLAYYRDLLLETKAPESQLYPVACSLADVMIRDGWLEEALEVVEPFEVDSAPDASAASLRVRALCGLDRPGDAVEELVGLVERCPDEDTEQLVKLYEQILRIDGGRADIEEALEALQRSPKRVLPVAIAAGAAVVLGIVILFVLSGSGVDPEKLSAWASAVREKVAAGEPQAALGMIDASSEFGSTPEARRPAGLGRGRARTRPRQTRRGIPAAAQGSGGSLGRRRDRSGPRTLWAAERGTQRSACRRDHPGSVRRTQPSV